MRNIQKSIPWAPKLSEKNYLSWIKEYVIPSLLQLYHFVDCKNTIHTLIQSNTTITETEAMVNMGTNNSPISIPEKRIIGSHFSIESLQCEWEQHFVYNFVGNSTLLDFWEYERFRAHNNDFDMKIVFRKDSRQHQLPQQGILQIEGNEEQIKQLMQCFERNNCFV